MKKQLITIFIISSAVFVSCSNDDDPTPTPTPTTGVKKGSVFTYMRTDYDSTTGTQVIASGQYTLTMLRDTTLNSEQWFVVERKDASKTQFGLIKFNTTGVFNYTSGTSAMDMKLNAAVNDTWVDASGQTVKVISLNQTVTVPAGTFTNATYVEKNDANSLENKTWYNNKEYLLKNEEYDESPSQAGQMIIDYRDELVSVVL